MVLQLGPLSRAKLQLAAQCRLVVRLDRLARSVSHLLRNAQSSLALWRSRASLQAEMYKDRDTLGRPSPIYPMREILPFDKSFRRINILLVAAPVYYKLYFHILDNIIL